MGQYAIYLRKSRADLDAEARGEGETLARHRTALYALAERRGLNVVCEYAEIITGDSIAARPQMQRLLDDVKRGLYDGVIVNDVDRLGRGDSIDQEIIKYTFVAGRCLIITPTRDINPASPTDEDMLDFNMFMARFELRKITQRLTQGRTRSAASGNYICPRVPYGYKKVTEGKRITLVPDEDTAGVVRMIFDWYASGTYGYLAIATKLNNMGYKTYLGKNFGRATVREMLKNIVYTGRISWGGSVTISAIEDGKRKKKSIKATPTIAEKAHPALVSDEVFFKVQQMFEDSKHAAAKHTEAKLRNPLAGLLYCSVCGKAMGIRGNRRTRANVQNDRLIACTTYGCPTRGTYLSTILDALLETLREWCVEYKDVPAEPEPVAKPADETIKRKIESVESQLSKAQDYLELGVYTPSEYLKRKGELLSRIDYLKKELGEPAPVPVTKAISTMVPRISSVLDAFDLSQSFEDKNKLLKSIVARIEYEKTEVGTKAVDAASLMKLTVYPRINPNEKSRGNSPAKQSGGNDRDN